MSIISILNQKGGCGKTTIAINLAHSFQIHGYNTLLADSDPQGCATCWNRINEGKVIPLLESTDAFNKDDIISMKQNYDLIIIDGAPSINKAMASIIKISDIVLIPLQPSGPDMWSAFNLVNLIKVRKETNKKLLAVFTISRRAKNTILGTQIRKAIEEYYELPALNTEIIQREIYKTVITEGLTVYHDKFNKRATNNAILEIDSLRNELITIFDYAKSTNH